MPADDAPLEVLARLTGLLPDSPRFIEALTHPSLANEQRDIRHNQRLEFLGDSILGFCASELLYARFPNADEGALTRMRAQLVNAEALAGWGRSVGLAAALRVGRGAATAGLREGTNVLADAVEALIAAAYLEAGLEQAVRLSTLIVEHGLTAVGTPAARDPKSELQERLQALGHTAPSYELVEERGPAHERWFRIRVVGADRTLAEGEGRSKRAAEQAAAAQALRDLEPALAVVASSGDAPDPIGTAQRRRTMKDAALPLSSRRSFAGALTLAVLLFAVPAFAGTYLNRAVVLLSGAGREGVYLRARLGDKELARVTLRMATARLEAARTMTVPKEVEQAHPHLLLVLENYQQAAEAATLGESDRFAIYHQRALDEERTFKAVLKQLGWVLPEAP